MTTQRPLTLAEVLEQVDRIGGDPATTTFRTWAGPVSADDNLVGRDHGAVVLDFSGDFDEYDDGADDLRMELVATNVELDRAKKIVTAARAWWTVEATRTSQTEQSSIWLEAEQAARRALCIATQDYETAEQLSAAEQAHADRAAELAEDTARADHAERSER